MTSPTPSSRPLVFVDDEPLILESLGLLFKAHFSCPVYCFSRPSEALAQLPALNPAVILTDYSMPGMNGMEFLAHAQRLLPRTNFLILTGEPIEFDEGELRIIPTLKEILRKPLHWKEVAESVIQHWPDEAGPVLHVPAMAV